MSSVPTANLWTMIGGSGFVVQIVLVLLVGLSLTCWTVIVAKIRRIRQASAKNQHFEDIFWRGLSLSQVNTQAQDMLEAPMAGIFLTGYEELKRLQDTSKGVDSDRRVKVWLDNLERSLQKGIKAELIDLGRGLPFLATTGNASPFIGLFGTVWGIMGSFQNIGLTGTASLATVAPGISEALIATATGLAAAIPAVIAYNTFSSSLDRIEADLNGFANDFLNTVERQLLQERPGDAAGRGVR